MDPDLFASARARVLSDLRARRADDAATVSLLEEALSQRAWWVDQWPEGAVYVAGLVAQDVQDALLESRERWPECTACEDGPVHALHIQPDLGGPEPVWVCEESGTTVAPLGRL